MGECIGSGFVNSSIDGENKVKFTEIEEFRKFVEEYKAYYKKYCTSPTENKTTNKFGKVGTETSTSKMFKLKNNADILFTCTAQYGKGMICSISLGKCETTLSQIEELRNAGIFKDIFNSDYPLMIEEFKDKMQLHFVLDNPTLKPVWNIEEEIAKKRKSWTLRQRLYVHNYPERAKKQMDEYQPKHYINCQTIMKNRRYTALMDCQKLFAPKIQKEIEPIK